MIVLIFLSSHLPSADISVCYFYFWIKKNILFVSRIQTKQKSNTFVDQIFSKCAHLNFKNEMFHFSDFVLSQFNKFMN